MKKTLLIALLLAAFAPIFAFEYTYEGNTLEYTILSDNTVSVKHGRKAPQGKLVIPEVVSDGNIEIFDPNYTYKRTVIENAMVREMLQLVMKDGKLVVELPTLNEIKKYLQLELKTLYSEIKRFDNPHVYYVDLSQKLWNLKNDLILKYKKVN